MGFNKQQICRFVNNAKERASGNRGWRLLGPELQKALVYEEACHVIMSQMLDQFRPAQELIKAMMAELEPAPDVRS